MYWFFPRIKGTDLMILENEKKSESQQRWNGSMKFDDQTTNVRLWEKPRLYHWETCIMPSVNYDCTLQMVTKPNPPPFETVCAFASCEEGGNLSYIKQFSRSIDAYKIHTILTCQIDQANLNKVCHFIITQHKVICSSLLQLPFILPYLLL